MIEPLEPTPPPSRLAIPSTARSARAIEDAHLVFGRTLSGWATDVLNVRHLGLQTCRWRAGDTEFAWNRAA